MPSAKRTVQHDVYVYVDTVVFTLIEGELNVLTVKRKGANAGVRSLPGGLVNDGEDLADAASRELFEETGLRVPASRLRQIKAYGKPDRDTRYGRAITIGFLAMVPDPGPVAAGSDAKEVEFIPYRKARRGATLEWDHSDIVGDARRLARSQLEDTPIALEFCKPKFTLTELRTVYEAFYQRELDPANFRRKIENIPDFVVPTTDQTAPGEGLGRPAILYRRGRAVKLIPPLYFRRTT